MQHLTDETRTLPASETTAQGGEALDPITLTVLLRAFEEVAHVMTIVFERTGWSAVIAIAKDFSCAIYDAQMRQICMWEALPIHINSQHLILEHIAQFFDQDIHDGDVFMCNDPYHGNTHKGDLTVAAPVFVEGKLRFWTVAKAHELDIGAPIPSSVPQTATDTWTDGLTIPPLRIVEGGIERKDALAIYLANMRWPEWLAGDLRAQIGSVETGKQRLLNLVDRYGIESILKYVDGIFEYSSARMREELRGLPEGTFRGAAWQDSDGQGNMNLPVVAEVTFQRDHVKVNFAGSAPQQPGAANCSYAVMCATAAQPILCCIDPDIPHNQGVIDHIEALAPEGSICNASWPASVATATIVPGDVLQDAVWRALAEAIPDRICGGWGRMSCTPMMAGVDERGGDSRGYGLIVFQVSAGGGAARETDGWPLISTTAAFGGTKTGSVELTELLYPLHFDSYEFEPDSAGAGKWRGGPGVRVRIRPVAGHEIEANHFGDGFVNPPFGVLGGRPGIGGGYYVEGIGGEKQFYAGKSRFFLKDGDTAVYVTTGGGGYGAPHERSIDLVMRDVRDGIVSIVAAARDYGVVIDETTGEVDDAASHAERAKLRAESPTALLQPTRPNAGRWYEMTAGPDAEVLVDAH